MAERKTPAHQVARTYGFCCATCGRPLKNAKYEGEFLYPLTIVYMRCNRCKALNEVNLNMGDSFYDVVTDIGTLPSQATKQIAKTPAREEEAATP